MPQPSLQTTYILAVVSSIIGLAVTQSLISNQTAQLVTGLASTFVPAILALAHALVHAAARHGKPAVVPAPPGVTTSTTKK